MKFFFTLVLMASSTVFAETIKDRIFAVEDGMVKFENGRVAFLDSSSFDLKKNEVITATIDEKSTLISVEKDYKETFKNASFDFDSIQNQIYSSSRDFFEPTVIKGGMQEAWNIFNRSNPYYKRISECTDRAHVWAHDEFKKNGTKSIKAFVLFTASYINSVRFKWWFHVAPMYKVNVDEEVQDLVMDYRFADGPKTVKQWTDLFVYTKRPCKITTKFSDYDVNPQTENCYLMFDSMYYRLPGELFDQEKKSQYKIRTTDSEIANSRRWGFEK